MYEPEKRSVGIVTVTWPYAGEKPTYYTLYVNGKEAPNAPYRDTEQEVIEQDLFPYYAFPGGYTIEYVTPGGDVLCAGCARKDYADDPESASYITGGIAEESQHSTGLMCDGCNEWIVAPHCVDCGDEMEEIKEKARTIFHDETGSYLLCSHCLAQAVTRKRAHKTGKRQYRVTDEWYRGQFTQEGAH